METIKETLRTKTTAQLLSMVEPTINSTDEGSSLVWDCLIDVLEERIGDKVWEL